MAQAGELIVGLDIGTTKICAIVGEVAEDDDGRSPLESGRGVDEPQGGVALLHAGMPADGEPCQHGERDRGESGPAREIVELLHQN